MACDLVKHHKKEVKMLAYLVSRKHVPTKMGAMYFCTWIDAKGDSSIRRILQEALNSIPLKAADATFCWAP